MKVLASFCNTVLSATDLKAYQLSHLAILDTERLEVYFVKTPLELNNYGVTGVTQDSKYIYVITQEKKDPLLLRFNKKNMKLLSTKKLTGIKDPHSLLCHEDNLYICSTGNNSVYKVDLTQDGSLPKLFWRYPGADIKSDRVHLNSIGVFNNELWVSCFGKKGRSKYWSNKREGYLVNINNFKKKFVINHPHSLMIKDGHFFFCESVRGSLINNNRSVYQAEKSYMRGLTVGKDVIFVGISSARMKSRSRNEVNNISATGDFVVRSGIVELDRGKYSFKNFYNLNLFFREIYDLMIVDNVNLNLKYFYPPKIISKSSRILENYLASSLITLLEESRRSVNVLIEKNKVLKEENRNLHGILEEIKSAKMFKLWQFYCERRDSIKNWLQIHFYDKEK